MDRWKLARLTACLAVMVGFLALGIVGIFRGLQPGPVLVPDPFGGGQMVSLRPATPSHDPFVRLKQQYDERQFDELIDLIRSTVVPETWQEVGSPGFEGHLSLRLGMEQVVREGEAAAD